MFRRDYILRMIEECVRALARIGASKKAQRWGEASIEVEAELKKLVGEDSEKIAALSESDLIARLMSEGPTHSLQDKTLFLIALLKEAGDVAAAEGRTEKERACYIKALNLLLDVLSRDEVFEFPQFVPRIDMLRELLKGAPLPARTNAMLMQHYERLCEFAKAEDTLFEMLDAEPNNSGIVEFGIAFYKRALTQTDATLNSANLPRAEVEEGLKELQKRL
jgi:tetratricopeptide (TPR) repeat protein